MKICSIFYKLHLASLEPVERIHFVRRPDEELPCFLKQLPARAGSSNPGWHVSRRLHADCTDRAVQMQSADSLSESRYPDLYWRALTTVGWHGGKARSSLGALGAV